MIRENIEKVRGNIAKACEKSGRKAEDVTLIAVSKTKPVSMLQEAYDCGCRDFGENKVQELVDKWEQMPKDIRWHMIGHLQRNKVKYIVDKAYLIHSVDSLRLAGNQQGGGEETCYRIDSGRDQCGRRRDKIRHRLR